MLIDNLSESSNAFAAASCDPETAKRKERSLLTDYWRIYQSCSSLFGERRGVLPYKKLNANWHQLVAQAVGCLASAFAKLATVVGDAEAMRIIEKEWGATLPANIVKAGILKNLDLCNYARKY